jgi:hypothetical protein
MEDVVIFFGHLVHFTVFCGILWTFCVVRGILVFFHVLVCCSKKNLATPPLAGGKNEFKCPSFECSVETNYRSGTTHRNLRERTTYIHTYIEISQKG